jgi:predicted DCC family thiol-disulfide oxidoreductase YuxK
MDYLPLQDPQLATRFPEIPRAEFEKAVHFIETSGAVYSAAEAVFRSLAKNSKWRWPLRWYKKSRAFAGFAETAYRFVARHREFFSWLSGTRD